MRLKKFGPIYDLNISLLHESGDNFIRAREVRNNQNGKPYWWLNYRIYSIGEDLLMCFDKSQSDGSKRVTAIREKSGIMHWINGRLGTFEEDTLRKIQNG